MLTFKKLWKEREEHLKHWPTYATCGMKVQSTYHAFLSEEDKAFHIKHFPDYYPEDPPPIIAKIYEDGNVWFRPHLTLRDKRKSSPEENLLVRCTGTVFMRNLQQARERGVGYYKDRGRIAFSAGGVLFDSYANVIEADPSLKRVITADLMKEYDELLNKVFADATVRAKLGVLVGKDDSINRWWINDAEEFVAAIRKVDPNDYKTFKQLAIWAGGRYAKTYHNDGSVTEHTIDESLRRMFAHWRPKVLEHVGAVGYA